MPIYARDTPTGWVAYFGHGLELEIRLDLEVPVAAWSLIYGRSVWRARWGSA